MAIEFSRIELMVARNAIIARQAQIELQIARGSGTTASYSAELADVLSIIAKLDAQRREADREACAS